MNPFMEDQTQQEPGAEDILALLSQGGRQGPTMSPDVWAAPTTAPPPGTVPTNNPPDMRAPGQPMSGLMMPSGQAPVPGAEAVRNPLMDLLGQGPNIAQAQAGKQDALRNLLSPMTPTSGAKMLEESATEDRSLLTAAQRGLLTKPLNDSVTQEIQAAYGSGKGGTAKRFLNDVLMGLFTGGKYPGSRALAEQYVQKERDFALKLSQQENTIQKQQQDMQKALAKAQLDGQRMVYTSRLAAVKSFDPDIKNEVTSYLGQVRNKLVAAREAGQINLDQEKLLSMRAANERAEFYNGIPSAEYRMARDLAYTETIQNGGEDPNRPDATPQEKAAFEQLTQKYWMTWKDHYTSKRDTSDRIIPIAASMSSIGVNEKGETVYTLPYLRVNKSTGAVESGSTEVSTKGMLNTPQAKQRMIASQQEISTTQDVYQSIAQAYLQQRGTAGVGADGKPTYKSFDQTDVQLGLQGLLKGNSVYQYLWKAGVIPDEIMDTAVAKDARFTDLWNNMTLNERRIAKQVMISGTQVAESERAELQRLYGSMSASPKILARQSLIGHYFAEYHQQLAMGDPRAKWLYEHQTAAVMQEAVNKTIERLERTGNTTPIRLWDIVEKLQKVSATKALRAYPGPKTEGQ